MDSLKPGGKKRILLIAGIAVSSGCLLVFKYSDFIRNTLHSLLGLFNDQVPVNPGQLVLPIGISFYSFKLISYMIDVYNEKLSAERHPGYFALYVSFFPQLLAGPIDRAVHFISQLKQKVSFNYERVAGGLRLCAWGFFKKLVIADRLAVIVNYVYDNVHQFSGVPLIIATLAYAFQIYCDFSGYSDIAIGLSRMLGYQSMKNFDFPYASESVVKFWNKWHISLSTWLRDYLFLPVTYAIMRRIKKPRLAKLKAETWGYICGIIITMFIGGLWHGANWTFVLWGMIHGMLLAISYAGKKIRIKWIKKIKLKKHPKFLKLLRITVTFSLINIAWIFFRANSISDAFYIITHLHTKILDFPSLNSLLHQKAISQSSWYIVIIAIALLETVQLFHRIQGDLNAWFSKKPLWFRWGCYYILLVSIVYLGKFKIKEFIYFQF
jgi:D-alanyl-lipoteichoic acid acyltransferase DltB (MBOAT superfamily)